MIPRGYTKLSNRFCYASLKVGTSVMDLSSGKEVYFQPGDSENDVIQEIALLSRIEDDGLTNSHLSEYFN